MFVYSAFVDISVVVICAASALYVYLSSFLSYWKDRNVPEKKPIPLFGNYAEALLLQRTTGEIAKRIYEEFSSERFVGTYFGQKPVLLIRDPEFLKLVMTKDFYYFSTRGIRSNPNKDPFHANLFASDGDMWKVLRQNLTPLFSSAKMRNMFILMAQSGIHFEDYLRAKFEKENNLAIVNKLMPNFSMDVFGSCAFGLSVNTMDGNEDNIFRRMGLKIFEASAIQNLKIFFRLFAPGLFSFFNMTIRDKKLDDFFINLVKQTIEEREQSQTTRNDFIDLMKNFKSEGKIKGNSIDSMQGADVGSKEVEIAIDDNLLAAQSFIFFAAGFETSSTTMSYALYELAKNPDIQTKVREEIDRILKKNGPNLTYEAIKEFEYLDMVVCETLRKYPVLGHMVRECYSNYTVPGCDLVIEKGTRIHIPLLALHRDAQYYPNPEKFDPSRFTKEAINNRHPYAYMPFGQGPRICIGLRFGKAQVIVGLVSLLKNFTVHPCENTPSEIQFSAKNVIMTSREPIYLNFKRNVSA